MTDKTISILKGEPTAAPGIFCWKAIEGGSSIPIMDVVGIQRWEASESHNAHYLLIRISRLSQDVRGLRVRLEREIYYIREVRFGVRISEMELLCETLSDYAKSQVRKVKKATDVGLVTEQ